MTIRFYVKFDLIGLSKMKAARPAFKAAAGRLGAGQSLIGTK